MESTVSNSNTQSDTDVSVVKLISFVLLAIISAMATGYFIAKISILYILISLIVFWIIFTLQVLFIKGRSRIIIALALETMAIAIPSVFIFESGFSSYMLIGAISLFVLLLMAEMSARSQVKNSLRIKFFKVAKVSLSKSIPALLVFISLIYLFVAGKDLAAKNSGFIADSIITPIFSAFIPGLSADSSFRDIIEKTAELRLGRDAYESLPSYVKDESVKQTQTFIEKYTGQINIDAPFSDVVFEFFTERLSGADLLTKLYVAITLVTLIWFIVRTATIILYIPIAILSFLVYELLIVTNFIVIQYESRSREIVLLN